MVLRWLDSMVLSGATAREMQDELARAELLDRRPAGGTEAPYSSFTGFVSAPTVRPLKDAAEFIEARIGVGMTCGYDETVAVYRQKPLRRLAVAYHEGERIDVPWVYRTVMAGPGDRRGRRLVAIAGYSAWCTSTMIGLNLRVLSIHGNEARTLLNRDVDARRFDEPVVTAQVGVGTVEFRYVANMSDGDFLHRPGVARFTLSGGVMTRAAPVALTRAGFIDEWLKMDAADAARWSAPAAMKHHAGLSARKSAFTFESAALCPENPRTWQVVLKYHGSEDRHAFVMRESGAAKMHMLDVLTPPRGGCRNEDITALVAKL